MRGDPWWTVTVRSNTGPSSDFRQRLAAIPNLEEEPIDDGWENAKPPIVRPLAPVARPAHTPERDRQIPQIPTEDEPPFIERPRRRRRWPWFLLVLALIAAVLIVVPLFFANRIFTEVERVPLGNALVEALPEGTNLLLVGTDSRDGIDTNTENSGLILGEGIPGSRTDTILVLRVEEGGSKLLSLPRDLWLPIDGGGSGRINSAFGQGPDALVRTVQDELGIPISHYVQVDLSGFIELVDAVGGVDITIPHPAIDRDSGLNLPNAGTVTLDSTQALAFVRSRTYTEIIDGVEQQDFSADLGRVQRQQEFLRALFLKISAERSLSTLNEMGTAIAQALIIDDSTSLPDALLLANALRVAVPESVTLPTNLDRIDGHSVLTLTDESPEVLAQFGG